MIVPAPPWITRTYPPAEECKGRRGDFSEVAISQLGEDQYDINPNHDTLLVGDRTRLFN